MHPNPDVLRELNAGNIEKRVLAPGTPEKDIGSFVLLLNENWGNFELNGDIFKRRLDSGHILIGLYAAGFPIGLLETKAIYVDDSSITGIPFHASSDAFMAYSLCELGPQNYADLTENGNWSAFRTGSNVLWMVDITTFKAYWDRGIGGIMIDFILEELSKPKKLRREQLRDIDYVPTLTPSRVSYDEETNPYLKLLNSGIPHEKAHRLHYRKGAFFSQYFMENAREGHIIPHVAPMFYLVSGDVEGLLQRISSRKLEHHYARDGEALNTVSPAKRA